MAPLTQRQEAGQCYVEATDGHSLDPWQGLEGQDLES